MANPSTRPPPPVTGYPAAQPQPPNGHPPPYAYPPQPSYYPYNYAPPQYQNPRATFLRRIIFFSIILFIIFGSILFITWLVLRPRLPEFTLTSLTVKNLTLTQQQRIYATLDFNLEAYNPNTKMSAKYESIEGSVSYKMSVLAVTTLAPFEQSTKGRDAVNGTVSVVGSYVDGSVARGVEKERDDRGSVEFDVRLFARVWFKSGAWRTRRRVLLVVCKNVGVSVDKSGSGKMLQNGPKRCEVGF